VNKTLRMLSAAVLFSLSSLAMAAQPYPNVAVVDLQAAVTNSNEAKAFTEKVNKEFEPQRGKIKKMAERFRQIKEKLEKDAAVMTQTEISQLQREGEDITIDLKRMKRDFQQLSSERQQDLIKIMGPKFDKAMEQVIKEEQIQVVLARQAALYVNPVYDITAKITEKLNKNR